MLKRAALAGLPSRASLSRYRPSGRVHLHLGTSPPQSNALGGADFQDAATGYAVGPRGLSS
jgi:hypothetical protein